MTPQEMMDAIWEKAAQDKNFVDEHLDEIEVITNLLEMGDVDMAVPKMEKLLNVIKDV